MVNLLYCTSEIKSAVSFYRGWGILSHLRKMWPELNVQTTQSIDWASLMPHDIVFIERPATSIYKQIVFSAKLNNKKVWLDYDDDLFSIPSYNMRNSYVNQDELRDSIVESSKAADLITVSTEALKSVFTEFNKNVHVVPNAYNKNLYWYKKKGSRTQKKIILWRGSETHDKDLMEVTEQMISVASKHSDFKWVFMGNPFWYTVDKLKDVGVEVLKVPPMDPISYMKTIYDIAPFIQIVPLCDNRFNQSKSNVAWIEATHAGATVIAPNFQEWKRPGIATYSSPVEFGSELDRLLREKIVYSINSEEYIEENLLLDKMNIKRKELIQSLL